MAQCVAGRLVQSCSEHFKQESLKTFSQLFYPTFNEAFGFIFDVEMKEIGVRLDLMIIETLLHGQENSLSLDHAHIQHAIRVARAAFAGGMRFVLIQHDISRRWSIKEGNTVLYLTLDSEDAGELPEVARWTYHADNASGVLLSLPADSRCSVNQVCPLLLELQDEDGQVLDQQRRFLFLHEPTRSMAELLVGSPTAGRVVFDVLSAASCLMGSEVCSILLHEEAGLQ